MEQEEVLNECLKGSLTQEDFRQRLLDKGLIDPLKDIKIKGDTYIGKTVTCLWDGAEYLVSKFDEYNSIKGRLWYKDCEGYDILIMEKGKWCSVETLDNKISRQIDRISKMEEVVDVKIEQFAGCFSSRRNTLLIQYSSSPGLKSTHEVELFRPAKQKTLDYLKSIK